MDLINELKEKGIEITEDIALTIEKHKEYISEQNNQLYATNLKKLKTEHEKQMADHEGYNSEYKRKYENLQRKQSVITALNGNRLSPFQRESIMNLLEAKKYYVKENGILQSYDESHTGTVSFMGKTVYSIGELVRLVKTSTSDDPVQIISQSKVTYQDGHRSKTIDAPVLPEVLKNIK